jgi:hypothetical protein
LAASATTASGTGLLQSIADARPDPERGSRLRTRGDVTALLAHRTSGLPRLDDDRNFLHHACHAVQPEGCMYPRDGGAVSLADEERRGLDWSDDELDIIVADYFAMLQAERSGQTYVKAQRNRALRERTGRSRGSVEFKHQNISAVLLKLGMDRIAGYKPAFHFQDALIDAVDRYVSVHGALMEPPPPAYRHEPVGTIFVAPPVRGPSEGGTPRLRQLIQKFDPVERDHRNRALGRAGEEFVLDVERSRLKQAGLSRLADNVRWIAHEEGDGAGYDILSFDLAGQPRQIEVKTTNGVATTPFFLSRNEIATAAARMDIWCLYRVHEFAKAPRIFEISPPLDDKLVLRPDTWRASFRA